MRGKGPLRAVLAFDSKGRHLLACGHLRRFRYTAYGPTYPAKSYCDGCRDGRPADVDAAELAKWAPTPEGGPNLGPLFA
jgi:hypothetical protein